MVTNEYMLLCGQYTFPDLIVVLFKKKNNSVDTW